MRTSQNSTMPNSIPFQITISIFNIYMMPNLRIKTHNQLKIDHFKHFLNKIINIKIFLQLLMYLNLSHIIQSYKHSMQLMQTSWYLVPNFSSHFLIINYMKGCLTWHAQNTNHKSHNEFIPSHFKVVFIMFNLVLFTTINTQPFCP
jgi:hypothetical protein